MESVFAGVPLGAGFLAGEGVALGGGEDGSELPLLRRGGASPESDPPDFESGGEEDAGGGEPEAESGVFGATLVAFVSWVKRGGASSLPMPTGAASATMAGLVGSMPVGCHAPVAIQGACPLAALLCSALFTVNSPSELPELSAS